jgi:hypothetical protein
VGTAFSVSFGVWDFAQEVEGAVNAFEFGLVDVLGF